MLVQASFDASKQRYGSLRIHEDLLEQQERVSRKRVIRLMQEVAPFGSDDRQLRLPKRRTVKDDVPFGTGKVWGRLLA